MALLGCPAGAGAPNPIASTFGSRLIRSLRTLAITLTQLQAFLAVLRGGSVKAAAEQLVVTQPSVSAAVGALSKELGVDLTERAGRGIRPSPAGEAFAPYAAEVLGLLEQGRRAAAEAVDAGERELRLSAVTTAGEYLAPPLIQAFGARRPAIAIQLDVGNRTRVMRRLADREADVAIAGRPPSDGRFAALPFLENEIVVVTAPDDPLAARRTVTLDDLSDRVWLLREEGSGSRAMTEDLLAHHDLSPRRLTLGSNGAIKHAVRAGLGVALQSRVAVQIELQAGLLATVRVRDGLPRRQWFVLWPSGGPARAVVDEFVAFAASREAHAAIDQSREIVDTVQAAARKA